MKKFKVKHSGGFETVEAEYIGMDAEALFFWNGHKTTENIIKTFNNRGGWLTVAQVRE